MCVCTTCTIWRYSLVQEFICKWWVYGCKVKAAGPEGVKIAAEHNNCQKAPTVLYQNPQTKINPLPSNKPFWLKLMVFTVTDCALPNPLVLNNSSSMSQRLVEHLSEEEMDLKGICCGPFQYNMTKSLMKNTPGPETLGCSLSKDHIHSITQEIATLVNKQHHPESNQTAFQATGIQIEAMWYQYLVCVIGSAALQKPDIGTDC